MVILPRQARDRQVRESKEDAFSQQGAYPANNDMVKWAQRDTTNTDGPGLWTGFYPEIPRSAAPLRQWRRDLKTAWQLLASVADTCATESARFDLADVGREYLQVGVCAAFYEEMVNAYNASSVENVSRVGAALVESVLDIDTLLSTHSGFTLGGWINLSRALGHTPAEKALMEWNARSQVTSWTPYSKLDPLPVPCAVLVAKGQPCHGIDGYAQKQWGGLSREQHAHRWQMFVDQLSASVADKRAMNLTHYAINYTRFMVGWENAQWNATELPVAGVGGAVGVSKALLRKYGSLDPI